MSDPDNTPTPTPTPTPNPTDTGEPGYNADWRTMRRAEKDAWRQKKREWRSEFRGPAGFGFPIGGLVILVIGIVFLLGNFGYHVPPHWWAALLLIPAVAALVSAIRFYRVDGPRSPRVIGPTVAGLVLLGLALAIFFGLNWNLFWPVVLIVVGLAAVSRYYFRRNG